MLIFTADKGREAIVMSYPDVESGAAANGPVDLSGLACSQIMLYSGRPRTVQAVDVSALVKLAVASGGVIEMAVAVGDTVIEMMPVVRVYGTREPMDEKRLWDGIEVGDERTFEQDPKYAIRLLVDIAIRALSPAINDPTTAVQALDQIEDLLNRLGQRHLEIGEWRDSTGELRLVVSFPAWEDLVRLAFDEICFCGASSVQVMRRMNAVISDLIPRLPEKRHSALRHWQGRVRATIGRSFATDEEKMDASAADRQGLGIPRSASRRA
jgi:uncharacterized membrane protein